MMQASFDFTANFHQGNVNSVAAHDSIKQHTQLLRAKVVMYVRNCGLEGATSDEIEKALQLPHQSISARLTEAKSLRTLVDSGRKRKTRSGRNAAVLIYRELVA